jgi:hypothetical protein
MCSYIAHNNWCCVGCPSDFLVPLPLLLYPRGRGYREGSRVGYQMIPNKTISLLAYFSYISIDIIIYALKSTSWFSRFLWMVGRVVTDPFLGFLSPSEVVPRVLILVKMK